MKKMWFFVVVITTVFGFVGCEKEPEIDGNSLVGTSWKLQGYFDIEANKFKKAMLTDDISLDDAENCRECYTLKFETDDKVMAQVVYGTFLFEHFLTDSAILSKFT